MAGTSNVPTALRNRITEAQNSSNNPTNNPTSQEGGTPQQPPAQPIQQTPAQPIQQTPAQPTQQTSAPAPGDGQGDRVTMSRAEVEQLRAQALRAEQAGLQAERMRDQMEALEQRLTELSAPANGSGQQGAAAEPTAQPQSNAVKLEYNTETAPLTDEDRREFGDSETFVTKVAKAVVVNELKNILPQIESMIQQAFTKADSAGSSVENLRRTSAKQVLEDRIGTPLASFIKTPEWRDYLNQTDEGSGFTHQQILATHLEKGNIEHASRVYKKFLEGRSNGQQQQQQQQAGYAGAMPTGASAAPAQEENQPQQLKYSDHKKAHQQYVKKQIPWDQYKQIQEEFDKAEKEGRIDYNS